jgi:uroporphyrinogen decarboxylase
LDIKKFILDSLNHESLDHVPLFYRGDLIINDVLIQRFGLHNIETDFQLLVDKLGADFYTGGVTLSDFYTYAPKYIGTDYGTYQDPNFFFTFGINSKVIERDGKREAISYFDAPRLKEKDEISDIKEYHFPDKSWFDFHYYKNILSDTGYVHFEEIKKLDNYFLGTLLYSSIFMISSYLRGMSSLLADLAYHKKYAAYLIDTIGEICLDVSKKNLSSIGEKIEIYGMWDDFAMQTGLMMHPDTWRSYYKPWYGKIIEEAKKYGLTVMFHCCGSCYEIIPDLIEIGVDILDPVQTSAKDMELSRLKKEFGKDICFHGGLDIQQLLIHGTPEDVISEVRRINDLFCDDGGLLYGPSHYITSDAPIDNVLAIYKAITKKQR